MAILELNGLSTALSGSFSATVVFPDYHNALDATLYPALYFLHDIGGNHTDILTVKNLQTLSNQFGLFIVAPSLMLSFGMDLPLGGKYGYFICNELPAICRHLFPLDQHQQHIGGIGFGAYGAVWHLANHPDAFSKCFAINGHYNIVALCEAAGNGNFHPRLTVPNLEAVFGNLASVQGSKLDILGSLNFRHMPIFLGQTENFKETASGEELAKLLNLPVHMGATEDSLFHAGINWLCKSLK